MIPQSTIRNEEWFGAETGLNDTLNNIPLTRDQRSEIDHYLSQMSSTFHEANEASKLND